MELWSQPSLEAVGTPLAEKLRPKSIHEILGQEEALSQGSSLRRLIDSDRIPSLILWGPPGTGKTSFAVAFAQQTKKSFVQMNSVDAGVKDLKEAGESARLRRLQFQEQTIVFLDEIHRLNRGQQDVLLPFLERGDFVLIGATTENPSFRLNAALLSRCRVVVFKKLSPTHLQGLATRTLEHVGLEVSRFSPEALTFLIAQADGDGRRLVNMLEQIASVLQIQSADPLKVVGVEQIPELLGHAALYHDRSGDAHYDTVSAFIKSIRGSDPDASLYYLARMLEAGEDPLFVARRLVILASEDVGNAEPRALSIAVAAAQAVEMVGLPEAAINLAQAVTFLASAPKSNRSYVGLRAAQAEVKKTGALPIPLSIRNAPTELMKNLGYGEGYGYAHEGSKGWLPQQFLPDSIKQKKFYEPSDRGFEKNIKAYLEWLKS